MWKPGQDRPQKGRNKKRNAKGSGTDEEAFGKGEKAPVGVKRLSSGLKNMRFMQRTSVSPQQVVVAEASPPRHPERSNGTVATTSTGTMPIPADSNPVHNNVDDREMDEAAYNTPPPMNAATTIQFVTATAEDMHGPLLLGRWSFGGYQPSVERMYQQSLVALGKTTKEERRKRKRDAMKK